MKYFNMSIPQVFNEGPQFQICVYLSDYVLVYLIYYSFKAFSGSQVADFERFDDNTESYVLDMLSLAPLASLWLAYFF